MAPQRITRRRARTPSPPPAPPPEPTRQEIFRDAKYVAPAWVSMDVLTSSGIEDEVKGLLRASGWSGLLKLHGDGVKEDTSEFLGTFMVDYHSPRHFTYRHRGHEFRCNFAQLRRVFRWPAGGRISVIDSWTESQMWNRLTDCTGYEPSQSIARNLKNPAIFYLHFVLARTIFGRCNGPDKVSRHDLGVLDMISRGQLVDWAYYFCKHIENLRLGAPVNMAGMVTYFLRARHPDIDIADHTVLVAGSFDYWRFVSGRNIRRKSDMTYEWIYHRDPARLPPSSPPRGPGRPRGSGRGRGRPRGAQGRGEIQIYDGAESSAQGAARAQQGQVQLEQAQIDAAFTAIRQIAMGTPYVVPFPAPPGWRPGQAIPDEYLQPYQPPPGPF